MPRLSTAQVLSPSAPRQVASLSQPCLDSVSGCVQSLSYGSGLRRLTRHTPLPPPLRAEVGWRRAGNCYGVGGVDILQLVRVLFSLYILHFTFYTLLAPSALKWTGEGQRSRCGDDLHWRSSTLSRGLEYGYSPRIRTTNYQLPTVLTSSVFSSRLMSNVSCPHYNRCRAKRRQYVSPRLTLHLESLGNMRPDNTERREYVIITSIIP